jgi:lipoprotein-releasing system permease protein
VTQVLDCGHLWLNRLPVFHPLSLFVGLRYVRARAHKFFVSFITWTALLGVCIGVAALIVILSVMNGLEDELRDRLLSLSAHARVVAAPDATPTDAQWAAAQASIQKLPKVRGVAPYAEIQVLAVRGSEMLPVTIRGIDPQLEGTVTDVVKSIEAGSLANLIPGSDRVILGEVVARNLGATVGDSVTLLVPGIATNGTPVPRLRELTVGGVFRVGLEDHDGTLMFSHVDDVRALAGEASALGLRIRFGDVLDAPVFAQQIRTALPKVFEVFDWTQDHANYFRAIRIEKTMMSIILLLIVAVAGFNIVAMLVMVVTDKRTDIAILRTFGASPRRVMGVFMTQGLVIGWLGVSLGILLGVTLALNVDTVVPFLERVFRFHIFDPDVYYFSETPSDLQWPNVVSIAVAAFVLTGLATVYPAWRASRVAPAEALRYE